MVNGTDHVRKAGAKPAYIYLEMQGDIFRGRHVRNLAPVKSISLPLVCFIFSPKRTSVEQKTKKRGMTIGQSEEQQAAQPVGCPTASPPASCQHRRAANQSHTMPRMRTYVNDEKIDDYVYKIY